MEAGESGGDVVVVTEINEFHSGLLRSAKHCMRKFFVEVRTKDVELRYSTPGLLKKYGEEIKLDSTITKKLQKENIQLPEVNNSFRLVYNTLIACENIMNKIYLHNITLIAKKYELF